MSLLFSLLLSVTPLDQLMEGNDRYVNDAPDLKQKRTVLVSKQKPIAVVVGCSDSRVPPEIVFDQYLGDLFVVRVAGNIAGPVEMDSIEFAVKELQAKLVVVLGHQSCGAVTAVVNGKADQYEIENIAPFIQPAVDETKGMKGDPVYNAIIQNIRNVIQKIGSMPVIAEQKGVQIIGAYYHLDSGKVELIQ